MKISKLLICALLPFYLMACNSKENKEESSEMQMDEHNHSEMTTENATTDDLTKSLPMEEHAMLGGTHFTIKYTAPVVKNRVIFGGLVGYNQVWVTGAHRATSIEFDNAIRINGTEVPAGKYGIFTIPNENEWTFILNENWDQHLADDYNQAEDILRLSVQTIENENVTERLKYSLNSNDDKLAKLTISWEKVSVEVPIELTW